MINDREIVELLFSIFYRCDIDHLHTALLQITIYQLAEYRKYPITNDQENVEFRSR